MAMTINPNQPRPVVLASNLCPPPVWPLPLANWVMLPTVPAGFPKGPFPVQSMGPISDGTFTPLPPCPGTGLVTEPEGIVAETIERRLEAPHRRAEREADRIEDREERRMDERFEREREHERVGRYGEPSE